jgi:hypothetical protein
MKHTILFIAITVSLLAEDAKPKPLTAAQQLEAARLQLALVQTGAQFESIRAKLQAAESDYRAIVAKLRKETGVSESCELNEKQEWNCPAQVKPEVKK